MRHTSFSLAIVALLLCGRALGQYIGPNGEYVAPGAIPTAAASTPDAAVPTPGTTLPGPDTVQPLPGTAPSPQMPNYPATGAQNSPLPLGANGPSNPQTPADPTMQQAEPIQAQPEMNGFAPETVDDNWLQQPPAGMGNPCSVGPCCALCGAGKCCPKEWYVDQRIRIMTHPKPRGHVFSAYPPYFYSTATSAILVTPAAMSAQSIAFDLASSYEITLGRYLGLDTNDRNHFLQFTFYGTNRWSAGASFVSTEEIEATVDDTDPELTGHFGNINAVSYNGQQLQLNTTGVPGFNRADKQWANYSSDLNNFELNLLLSPRARADRLVLHKNGKWRRECQQGIFCSWLAGARLLTINERYDFTSSSTIRYTDADDNTDDAFSTSTGLYNVTADNTLFGLQVGPEWTYRKCRAEFGAGVKGSAYINFAKQESWINITDAAEDKYYGKDFDPVNIAEAANTSAVSIELDINASYKIRPNFILKANYELLYMAGLALAPEQVSTKFGETLEIPINTGGSLLFQSGTFGFEYTW